MSHIHIVYLLIALQVLDALTTIYALERPGAAEQNGLAAKVFKTIGLVPGALLIKVAVVALIWHFHTDVDDRILMVLCAVSAVIVGNNLNVIRKQRTAKS